MQERDVVRREFASDGDAESEVDSSGLGFGGGLHCAPSSRHHTGSAVYYCGCI